MHALEESPKVGAEGGVPHEEKFMEGEAPKGPSHDPSEGRGKGIEGVSGGRRSQGQGGSDGPNEGGTGLSCGSLWL